MAEDKLNPPVGTTTFATPEPETTELERIQQRIKDFRVNVTPQVAQYSQILMAQVLEKPTKLEDLDAYITMRNELKEGLDDYQTQLASAQKRMVQLTEEHNQQKQMELARREQDLMDARNVERKRRKEAEEKTAQLEAVLASHGINIDLNNDGVIGLVDGQEAQPLDIEQQKSLKELLEESQSAVAELRREAKAEVPRVETIDEDEFSFPPPQEPEQPKKPSKAFGMARLLNPEPTVSEESQEELEPITTATQVKPEVILPVPTDAKGTDEFLVTVDEVEDEDPAEQEGKEIYSGSYDANGSPVADTVVATNKPVISDSNAPNVIEAEIGTPSLNVRIVPEDEIADFEKRANGISAKDFPEDNPSDIDKDYEETDNPFKTVKVEEEYEEVTVPSESDLKGMTKSKIRAEALKLGFEGITTKGSKSDMIESFVAATNKFIAELQETGDFISASDDIYNEGKDETATGNDDRDGGYINT